MSTYYSTLTEDQKVIARAKCREYYQKNKDSISAKHREWVNQNKDRIAESDRVYWKANPEKKAQKDARSRLKNHDKIKSTKMAYHTNNRQAISAQQARWRASHPEMIRANNRKRKALKKGSLVNDLTIAQWIAIKTAFNGRCVYCGVKGKRLTQDHIIPLSKGGHHTMRNVVPACLSCNCGKKAGPPPCPVQPLMIS